MYTSQSSGHSSPVVCGERLGVGRSRTRGTRAGSWDVSGERESAPRRRQQEKHHRGKSHYAQRQDSMGRGPFSQRTGLAGGEGHWGAGEGEAAASPPPCSTQRPSSSRAAGQVQRALLPEPVGLGFLGVSCWTSSSTGPDSPHLLSLGLSSSGKLSLTLAPSESISPFCEFLEESGVLL